MPQNVSNDKCRVEHVSLSFVFPERNIAMLTFLISKLCLMGSICPCVILSPLHISYAFPSQEK